MTALAAHVSGEPLKWIMTFIISMVPVVELRGAIPFGVSQGLPLAGTTLLAIAGNMVPVPFIILTIRRIFAWLKKSGSWLAPFVEWLEDRAGHKSKLVVDYQLLGLCILVAIPLPGTGAWTGALVAALLELRLKNALPAIFAGVCIAGAIVAGLAGTAVNGN